MGKSFRWCNPSIENMSNVHFSSVGEKGDVCLRATLQGGAQWRSEALLRGMPGKPPRLTDQLESRCRSYAWPQLATAPTMETAFKVFRMTQPNKGHIPPGKRVIVKGKMHVARQTGTCWTGKLDERKLKEQGFVTMRGFLAKGGPLVTGLHTAAVAAGTQKAARVHAGIAVNQARVSELVAKGTVLDSKGKQVALVASDDHEKLLTDLEEQFCAVAGLGGWKTAEFMTGTPGTDKGIVHGDNDSNLSSIAAVIVLNSEGGVGPFFVQGARTTKKTTFAAAKGERWQRVEANAKDKSKTLSMIGSSGAPWDPPVEVTAAGRPSRKGAAARPMLEQGDAVFFDSTSPHAAPGTLLSEPARVVMYLAFHSHKVSLHTVVSSAVHADAQMSRNGTAIPTVSAHDYISKVLKPKPEL
jgi:hypothetical protein